MKTSSRFAAGLTAGAVVLWLFGAGVAAYAQSFDLSQLRSALHLRLDQEAAWSAYAAAVAPDPDAASRRQSAAMLAATLTTPRRVDLLEAEMDADIRDAKRKGEAVKTFYRALDPVQQRTFDSLTAPRAPDAEGRPSRR